MLSIFGCGKSYNEKFLSRCARFDMMDNQVVIIDPGAPRLVTLDPWPELVFMAADGQNRVKDLADHLGKKYEDGPPKGLEKQVNQIVHNLLREGLVKLSDVPIELPYYLSIPRSEQDPDKAKKLMEDDGFIKKAR